MNRKFLLLILSAFLLLQGVLYAPTQNVTAYAESAVDPAPEILPVGTANGKTVLFDNTHGETAGAADWIIDGAFSDFGNALANQGYDVKELRLTTPISYSDIQNADVFVLSEPNIPLKTTEQAALLQYVQSGGSILFIADHYNADRNKNRWDGSESINGYRRGAFNNPTKGMSTGEVNSAEMQGVTSTDWLATNFGIRYRYNALGDVVANQVVSPSQSFNITSGVSTFAMHAGSTLAIIDPLHAKGIVYLPQTTSAWSYAVDQGNYDGGGTAEGPMVAVSKVSAGKAAFIGDSSPVEDASPKYLREETGASKTTYAGFQEQNDSTLLTNLVNWLATHESYTSFDQVSGLQLDSPTQLLAMETPQTSTEPQAEPWATPAAGYNWYDSSTFKAGSYGYITTGGSGGGSGTGSSPDLFFSEYDEGSSYNKALEIYNGTGATVDLSSYSIAISNNTSDIALSGSLASGSVYVIANPSASSTILSVANTTNANINFNGNDSCTLKHNSTAIDDIGSAGSTFGQDVTLVRKSTVTQGITTYDATQWDTYPKDTWTYLGSHTVQASQTITSSEDFETGSKGSYAAANVTLSSGSWYFDNALIGNLSSDQKNGTQSARIKANGSIAMNFDVAGAKTIKLSTANFGSDTGTTWKLQKSTDAGTTWVDVTSAAASTSTLQQTSITVNETGSVRFRIYVSGTSGKRLNVDDVQILN